MTTEDLNKLHVEKIGHQVHYSMVGTIVDGGGVVMSYIFRMYLRDNYFIVFHF